VPTAEALIPMPAVIDVLIAVMAVAEVLIPMVEAYLLILVPAVAQLPATVAAGAEVADRGGCCRWVVGPGDVGR
jgi:hypothetical protein